MAGCEAPRQTTTPAPSVNTDVVAIPAVRQSDASVRLQAYYAGVQARMRATGRMRTQRSPSDAPFSNNDVIRNFTEVALFDEYAQVGGRFIQRRTPSTLRRWESPIRVGVVFGPFTSDKAKRRDMREVRSYTARLATLTGRDIRITDAAVSNFTLFFLNKDEQKQIDARAANIPHLIAPIRNEIRSMPRDIFCVAYALTDGNRNQAYKAAVILIKAEHPDAMRTSCIQEEMAQAMGLANDSPDARPSIFNDDEEFAALTRHDELLLQILYDPRMKLGMTPTTAQPVLRKVVADLLGGSV